MRTKLTRSGILAVVLILVTVAQPRTARAEEDGLLIYSAGIDKMLVDEKDQGLRDALKMIGLRIMELPEELDEPQMPGPIISAVLEMLMSPMVLQAGALEEPPNEKAPPFYAQLTVMSPNDRAAAERAGMFLEIMKHAGDVPMEPVPGLEGMNRLDLDGVPGYLGATRIGDHPSFVVALNRLETEPPKINPAGLLPGVEPVFAFHLDAQHFAPLIEMFLSEMPPAEAGMVRGQLEMMGITGESPIRISAVSGYSADYGHLAMRYSNYAAIKSNAAMLATTPLAAADLKMIPRDATFAEVGRMNFGGVADVIRSMAGQMPMGGETDEDGEPVDPIEQLAELSGVHLEHDVLDHLGEAWGMYMSDATGGGGFLSAVAYLEVTDEAALQETFDGLAEKANALAAEHARGYVRISQRKLDDHRITTLMFPGLPVPLELSWSIEGGYLWMGASPQTVLAGMAQAASPGQSLLDNPTYAELAPEDFANGMSLVFLDTARLSRDGYSWLGLGMAALSNALRSPSDPDRDPGMILPPFNVLVKGAKGNVTFTYLEGDDLVMIAQGDRSALVNLSAMIAMVGNSYTPVAVAGLGVGLTLPALAKAREQAQHTVSASQLRNISTAMAMYAAEHEDRLAPDAQALIDAGYIDQSTFTSPLGPVYDDGGDYWFNPRRGSFAEIQYPNRMIAAYDRAAYTNYRKVPVLFYDGHVEMMEIWDFMEMLEDPIHEGIDFNLP